MLLNHFEELEPELEITAANDRSIFSPSRSSFQAITVTAQHPMESTFDRVEVWM